MPVSMLASAFEEKILAGVPGLMIQTWEYEEALRTIAQTCQQPGRRWRLMVYDMADGLARFNEKNLPELGDYLQEGPRKDYVWKSGQAQMIPKMAIRALRHLQEGLKYGASEPNDGELIPGILVMVNHQRWLLQPDVIQTVITQLQSGRSRSQHLVFLSVTSDLPKELEKLFEAGHIRHALPSREELRVVAESFVDSCDEDKKPDEPAVEQILDAAAGLTAWGAEAAMAISITRHRTIRPREIFDLKAESLAASASGISMYQGGLTFDDYGGSEYIKQFLTRMLSKRESNPRFRAKGVFLVGLPGSGKTHLAKCSGNTFNRATAIVTMAAMKSKYQGQSHQQMRDSLDTLDAMSPLIALLDEIEGQVSGGKDTGATDGGVGGQMNASLLHWLSERESDVFVIASCNDIRPIVRDMPELLRAGRFDAMFFMDYPSRASKDEIWRLQLVNYEFLVKGFIEEDFQKIERPDDTDWTAAEIEACCRLSRLQELTIAEVGKDMPTIASQAGDTIDAIRNWADGRCYATEYPGIYRRETHQSQLDQLEALETGRPRRRVQQAAVKTARGPSHN